MNRLRNEVDPLYFFGTDPKTNTYSFWSLLEQPKEAGGLYKMQLYFSWIPQDGDASLAGITAKEVFELKGSTMFPMLLEVMAEMPKDTVISYVNLVEWPVVDWNNWDSMATLAGDSAHCMSICKSPAARSMFQVVVADLRYSRPWRRCQPRHHRRVRPGSCPEAGCRWRGDSSGSGEGVRDRDEGERERGCRGQPPGLLGCSQLRLD